MLYGFSFFVEETHQKHTGYTMPGSYPARLSFLYAGLCVIFILREASPPRAFRSTLASGACQAVATALLIAGSRIGAFTMMTLNPWTGSLWMIGTCILMIMLFSTVQSRALQMASEGLTVRQTGMSCIAAFCWWGALQGFVPALLIAIRGQVNQLIAQLRITRFNLHAKRIPEGLWSQGRGQFRGCSQCLGPMALATNTRQVCSRSSPFAGRQSSPAMELMPWFNCALHNPRSRALRAGARQRTQAQELQGRVQIRWWAQGVSIPRWCPESSRLEPTAQGPVIRQRRDLAQRSCLLLGPAPRHPDAFVTGLHTHAVLAHPGADPAVRRAPGDVRRTSRVSQPFAPAADMEGSAACSAWRATRPPRRPTP